MKELEDNEMKNALERRMKMTEKRINKRMRNPLTEQFFDLNDQTFVDDDRDVDGCTCFSAPKKLLRVLLCTEKSINFFTKVALHPEKLVNLRFGNKYYFRCKYVRTLQTGIVTCAHFHVKPKHIVDYDTLVKNTV